MKELMLIFSGIFHKRYSSKQKKKFINFFAEKINEMGYKFKFLSNGKRGKSEVINLIVGDIEKAQAIFIVPYDTPSTILYPGYKYFPLNKKINARNDLLNIIIARFLAAILVISVYFLILLRFNRYANIIKILLAIIFIIIIFIVYTLLKGIPNNFNFNRNTSAIVLIYSMAEKIKNDNKLKNKFAFILTDSSTCSYQGYNVVENYFKSYLNTKRIIILDCIGYGESLILVHTENTDKESKKLINLSENISIENLEITKDVSENMCLQIFPNGMYLCCGHLENNNITIYNTRSKKDCNVDIDRLEKLSKLFRSYLSL